MKKLFLLMLTLGTLINGATHAHDKKPRKGNYLIVNRSGGRAMARLTVFFAVNDTALLCDTSHAAGFHLKDPAVLTFGRPLPQDKYLKVKDLPAVIPAEILSGPADTAYGLTRIDGGYINVWACVNGKKYRWSFGDDQTNSSEAVKQFYRRLLWDFPVL